MRAILAGLPAAITTQFGFRLKYTAAKERCDRTLCSARLGESTLQPRSRYFLSNFFRKGARDERRTQVN